MITGTTAHHAGLAALSAMLALVAACSPPPAQSTTPAAAATTGSAPVASPARTRPDLIYARVTDANGATYQGRLRWGGDQEGFWSDHFDGWKDGNPWAARLSAAPRGIEIFGVRLGGGDRRGNLGRPFMARFGDLARIDAQFARVQVSLKSGSTVELNRFEAGDIDDGVRVWDESRGIVDLDARQIRTIEFLPTGAHVVAAGRLRGTVRTRGGEFTGFLEWDGREGLTDETLDGRSNGRDLSLPYETIRAIARASRDGVRVTLRNGREQLLTDNREVTSSNRGIYVDDGRYGRVRISWDAFERVEFTPGGSGPPYDDYPAGRPLIGSVTTRDGRRIAGRLVYDIDESESTDTLDVSVQGVDYSIPFSRIAAIRRDGRDGADTSGPTVTLRDGGELQLERNGDLADGNGGLLIFIDGQPAPEHVPWGDAARIDVDTP